MYVYIYIIYLYKLGIKEQLTHDALRRRGVNSCTIIVDYPVACAIDRLGRQRHHHIIMFDVYRRPCYQHTATRIVVGFLLDRVSVSSGTCSNSYPSLHYLPHYNCIHCLSVVSSIYHASTQTLEFVDPT